MSTNTGPWQGKAPADAPPKAPRICPTFPAQLTAAQLQQRLHAAPRVRAATARRRCLISDCLLAQHLVQRG